MTNISLDACPTYSTPTTARSVRLVALVLCLVLAAGALALGSAWPASAGQPVAPAATPEPSLYASANERIGVGLVKYIADIDSYDMSQLGAGWYADWGSRLAPPHPNGMDYVQLIPVRPSAYPPNWDVVAARARANPGSLWLIGNEQEAEEQGKRTPAEYAEIYHDAYTQLKSADPTAQVGFGGVILPSPLRLQWMEMTLQEYQMRYGVPMPVDVWTTHMQLVQEHICTPENCYGAFIPRGISATVGLTMSLADNASYDLFVQLITGMRKWMEDHGQRNKPLMVSEYGVLYPSTYLCDTCGEDPARGDALVASFMTRTFEFMLTATDASAGYPADGNRLVQRWMWYALNEQPYNFDTGEGFNGSLFVYSNTVYPGTLTYFGQVFSDTVRPLKTPYLDLTVGRPAPIGGNGMYSVTVDVLNLGNTPATNVIVRLYQGDPGAGARRLCGDAVVPALGIRYSWPVTVRFRATVAPGETTPTFCAVVDPDGVITESNESNNMSCVTVAAYSHFVMLPLIQSGYVPGGQ